MKFRLVLLAIFSCILLYRVTCHEGVIRVPQTSSKVEFKSIVPKCFMDRVDDLFKPKMPDNFKAENAWINPKENRRAFKLVVSEIGNGIMEVIDQFTVLVVAMVERNKTKLSLKFVIDYMELGMSKLSRCIKFLFDNEADVMSALTGYIFFSDFKNIFKTYFGNYYTYDNIVNVLRIPINEQIWWELSQRVQTVEIYDKLYAEVEQSLEDISKTYQQPIVKSSLWLSPQCLKWSYLLESNTKVAEIFKEVMAVDNENIYNQYLQIKHKFHSVKVMNFYVKVGKVLDNIVLQIAVDMTKSFLKLILRLILDYSNIDNNFAQIDRANQFVEKFLTSVRLFENWMSYSKRLESSKKMLGSPIIKVLQDNVSYCKQYNSTNFPTTIASFLIEFENYFKKHIPGLVLDSTKVANELTNITQTNIIDNMERNVKVMVMLLKETTSSQCS